MPRRTLTSALIFIAACASWTGVSAQTVYRCGDSYSTQPCDQAKPVTNADPRSPAQQQQAQANAARDGDLAQRMEQERLAREKAAGKPAAPLKPAVATPSAPQAPVVPPVLTPKPAKALGSGAKPFVAQVPASAADSVAANSPKSKALKAKAKVKKQAVAKLQDRAHRSKAKASKVTTKSKKARKSLSSKRAKTKKAARAASSAA